MNTKDAPVLIPSLVDRAGARLSGYNDNPNQLSVRAGEHGRASIILTREYGQGGYVAGIACLDAEGRVISQAIMSPGWEVFFEEPQEVAK